jgi:hypothetical protein
MNFLYRLSLSLSLSSLILAPQIHSAPQQEPANDSIQCSSPLHTGHVGFRQNEARGIGYKEGYTTMEVFTIFDQISSSYFMPFFDLRGHVFNNGKLAGNAGIGERTLIPSIEHVFGSYVYYDVRNDNHGLTIHQISPGLELLSKRMEYRINGYFPVGDAKSHKYDWDFDKFRHNGCVEKFKFSIDFLKQCLCFS